MPGIGRPWPCSLQGGRHYSVPQYRLLAQLEPHDQMLLTELGCDSQRMPPGNRTAHEPNRV
jgi:hypothetical protein